MKAIGYKKTGPIDELDSLIEFETERPSIGPRDLLVEVHGISVNPVDVKVRVLPQMGPAKGETKIIGYDASGVVCEVGRECSLFKVGDEVFYSGDLTRPGTNSELHAVDERIVGKKPQSIGFAEAAGFPLTSITAWEILFNCYSLHEGGGRGETILIVGAAGGVGSILVQLAKKLTDLTVIATASRPDTAEWVKSMGADHVINHHDSIIGQIKELGIAPSYVASLNGTEKNFPAIVDLIQPRGHIAIIDDPENLIINPIKLKSLSFSWEFMFARSMFLTSDMNEQHKLLNRISELIVDSVLVSTVSNHLGRLSAKTLKEAHKQQESGKVIGKNVLDGF